MNLTDDSFRKMCKIIDLLQELSYDTQVSIQDLVKSLEIALDM